MVELILSMQGGSLKKELYEAGISATASAFVQQRNKISWEIFENILLNFNKSCTDDKRFKGYKIVAVDGTSINMARNENSESYVNNGTGKGYNQLHVTALYDILNKTFQYCYIQPQPTRDEKGGTSSIVSTIQ